VNGTKCIEECVEWEAELLTRENDSGSKKSGLDSDNMLDDSHTGKLALVLPELSLSRTALKVLRSP
jgi:hypothetical protein